MHSFKIDRGGFVTDRATGRELGQVFRSSRIQNNGDGTGTEIDTWKARDRHGEWGGAWPSYFATRRDAAVFLATHA